MDKLLISRAEAAAALSVSLRHLTAMISSGQLPVRRLGRRVLISQAVLMNFAKRDHMLPQRSKR